MLKIYKVKPQSTANTSSKQQCLCCPQGKL